MAVPGIPQNVYLQQGNGQVYLQWDILATATSYQIQRSTDGVTFSNLATSLVNNYLDTTPTVGTLYYYQVAGINGSGTGSYAASQNIVPTNTADLSLSELRLLAQQRADRVNSNFVTLPEWNTYINQSYFELYDLLTTVYEDYFLKPPYQLTTTGVQFYNLPSDFYKLSGVDCGLSGGSNAWVTLNKFDFIERNRFVYPSVTSTFLGVFNLRYRLLGTNPAQLMLIPTPAAGQILQVWYAPKLTQLLKDTDIAIGFSGWTEYIVVDAAIKALTKEESDTTSLMLQKQALKARIEETAANRDFGQPDTISDTRRWGGSSGNYGPAGSDGGFGGY